LAQQRSSKSGLCPALLGEQSVVAVVATTIPAAREVRGSCRKAKLEGISMSEADKAVGSLSGLTDQEAKEFHSIFANTFVIFLVLALAAHFLVWQWKPWFLG
jgi:light-harvesting complex 1 beta chain